MAGHQHEERCLSQHRSWWDIWEALATRKIHFIYEVNLTWRIQDKKTSVNCEQKWKWFSLKGLTGPLTVRNKTSRRILCFKQLYICWPDEPFSFRPCCADTDLPLSLPTPQTRMLPIGWAWSRVWPRGSIRFIVSFSRTITMSLPC